MKACRDCRHVSEDAFIRKCLHPTVAMLLKDYFDGTERLVRPSINIARSVGECGEDGKLWEPAARGFV